MYHLPSQLVRWCPTALPRPQSPPSGSSHYLCVCICMLYVMVSPGWFSKLMIGALGGRLMYRFSRLLKSLALQLISLPPHPHSKSVKDACKEAVMMLYHWSVKTGALALTMTRLGFSESFISHPLSPIPPNWLCLLSATPHSAVIIGREFWKQASKELRWHLT